MFVIMGFIVYTMALNLIKPMMRAMFEYKPTTCTVMDNKILQSYSGRTTSYDANFLLSYQVANQNYSHWARGVSDSYSLKLLSEDALARYKIGKVYPCWYDPNEPETVVLKRPFDFSQGILLNGMDILYSVFFPVLVFIWLRILFRLVQWLKGEKTRAIPQAFVSAAPEEKPLFADKTTAQIEPMPLQKLKALPKRFKLIGIKIVVIVLVVTIHYLPLDVIKKSFSFLF